MSFHWSLLIFIQSHCQICHLLNIIQNMIFTRAIFFRVPVQTRAIFFWTSLHTWSVKCFVIIITVIWWPLFSYINFFDHHFLDIQCILFNRWQRCTLTCGIDRVDAQIWKELVAWLMTLKHRFVDFCILLHLFISWYLCHRDFCIELLQWSLIFVQIPQRIIGTAGFRIVRLCLRCLHLGAKNFTTIFLRALTHHTFASWIELYCCFKWCVLRSFFVILELWT